MGLILNVAQSKFERRGIEPDKIGQVMRDGIGVQGMQDNLSTAVEMSFE